MAFNFNWSPLIADTSRAREMLTAALNKYPKPPIIVDDIIVTELNLGSTPPELEIRDIGDLAEDRFRGIFKMSYTGDAFLTLKTKVQANPLKTHLQSKPDFASPQPLAASSGLTIPLKLTLSDIRLSGIVILVFSRQKGLTLVFQDDPLQSLKVSSTFDSIPFVRDYLQKEIEKQLRNLFMEDLPAILHRLSLRLWSPEYQEVDDEKMLERERDTTPPIDPLATPPQDAVDAFGNPLDENEASAFSLEHSYETHASFSQKNLLRLAALTESHHTLALFTPSIRDAIFRAWAKTDRSDHSGTTTPFHTLSNLSRVNSSIATPSSASLSDAASETGTMSSRPTLCSFSSATSLGTGRSRAGAKKPKRRVVNLRRDKKANDEDSEMTDSSTPANSYSASGPASVIPEEKEDLSTPERSPEQRVCPSTREATVGSSVTSPSSSIDGTTAMQRLEQLTKELQSLPVSKDKIPDTPTKATPRATRPPLRRPPQSSPQLREKAPAQFTSQGPRSYMSSTPTAYMEAATSGGILEQAWMAKMAQEISRKVAEEKARGNTAFWAGGSDKADGLWDAEMEDVPPPAYAA